MQKKCHYRLPRQSKTWCGRRVMRGITYSAHHLFVTCKLCVKQAKHDARLADLRREEYYYDYYRPKDTV